SRSARAGLWLRVGRWINPSESEWLTRDHRWMVGVQWSSAFVVVACTLFAAKHGAEPRAYLVPLVGGLLITVASRWRRDHPPSSLCPRYVWSMRFRARWRVSWLCERVVWAWGRVWCSHCVTHDRAACADEVPHRVRPEAVSVPQP